MAEYMSRNDYCKACGCPSDGWEDCENCIMLDVPAADVEPVRRGHWIINSDGYYPQCSECMKEPQGRVMTDWCPNCGARMKGEENGRY